MSYYVCRDHLEPISWKGTGCEQCDRERRKRRHGHTTGAEEFDVFGLPIRWRRR